MEWTEKVIAELRQLWDEGHSTTEIGRRMGVTKNTIIGKSQRLELSERRKPALPPKPKRLGKTTLPPLPSLRGDV